MNPTGIEWVHNPDGSPGYTWNPITGCLNHMGELFGDWIPKSWQEQVFNAIKANPDYRFYLLTKQPQNLPQFSPFLPNCWVGVTVTSQDNDILSNSLRSLIDVDAKVKFISFEPLLGEINVSFYPDEIQWLIIGACTGTLNEMQALYRRYHDLSVKTWGMKWTAQPRIEWVREIVEAADKAGIPVFLKENLKPLLPKHEPFYKERHWHAGGVWELRQEMPEIK